MYNAFYGFSVKPFSKTPDPDFVYMSSQHREALARLVYGVEEREIVVLTGEVGCGKTTLSRCLMDRLGSEFDVITIVAPLVKEGELLRLLAKKLGVLEPSIYLTELMDQCGDALFKSYELGRVPVLIIDEAQLIPGKESMDELRLLSNLQLDDVNLFSMVLLGQPELRSRLMSGYYEPFRQRIGMQYHLNPLDYDDVSKYIRYRLERAGRIEPLFTESAVEEIYRFSGGIPRKINNIISNALIEGFGTGTLLIDSDIIIDVAKDFGLIGWNQ